jgi:hypothetical protein
VSATAAGLDADGVAVAAPVRGDPPCFVAVVRSGAVSTRGETACFLGHRLRSAGADDGVFAEWRWDGDTLTVVNDRYGMQPLFYTVEPDAIRVSPSIPALIAAGAPADFDAEALSVFLRIGFFVGDDTPFARIRAMPPDARLVWRRGDLGISGGPRLRAAAAIGRESALDGYIELFRRAIRRRIPGGDDFAVPLSGGRDSRHILLELCEQGARPRFCVTAKHYPPFPDEDARVATLLTAALGLPHVVLDQIDRFDAERRKNALTSFCADEHAWTLAIADHLGGRAGAIYDGIAGDVLSAGLFVDPERQALSDAQRTADLAELLLPTTNERTLGAFLRPGAVAPRRHAAAHLAAALDEHAGAANPIGSFYFWNRTRREINLVPFAIMSSVGCAFAPYLDHELFDFLAALPVGLLRDRQLHTDAIRRAYPRYREIPFQDKSAPRRNRWALRRGLLSRLVPYARSERPSNRLTRAASPLLAGAAFAHRYLDVGRAIQPEVVLYLLQLERLAGGIGDER